MSEYTTIPNNKTFILWYLFRICYWPPILTKQGDNALGSVYPSIHLCLCLSFRTALPELFDIWPWFLVYEIKQKLNLESTKARPMDIFELKGQMTNWNIMFSRLALRWNWGQRSRSCVWCVAVDIRGDIIMHFQALPKPSREMMNDCQRPKRLYEVTISDDYWSWFSVPCSLI